MSTRFMEYDNGSRGITLDEEPNDTNRLLRPFTSSSTILLDCGEDDGDTLPTFEVPYPDPQRARTCMMELPPRTDFFSTYDLKNYSSERNASVDTISTMSTLTSSSSMPVVTSAEQMADNQAADTVMWTTTTTPPETLLDPLSCPSRREQCHVFTVPLREAPVSRRVRSTPPMDGLTLEQLESERTSSLDTISSIGTWGSLSDLFQSSEEITDPTTQGAQSTLARPVMDRNESFSTNNDLDFGWEEEQGTESDSSLPSVSTRSETTIVPEIRPTDLDVLLGRGGLTNKHAGSQSYLEHVKSRQGEYREMTSKRGKTICSLQIVEWVHNRGGRFLQKQSLNSNDGLQNWSVAPPRVVQKKVSNCLRQNHTQ
jgi:hypothetical protein